MNPPSQELNTTDRQSSPLIHALRLTLLVNVVAALLILPSHGFGFEILCGLMAGQTALLATRVGVGDELLSLRLWNAQIGLVFHVAVIGLISLGAGAESLAISLSALSTSMVGVAMVTWLESVRGLACRLRPDEETRPHFHFSVSHLFVAMTVVAALMLLCRWAASFGSVSQMQLLLFAVHQLIVMAIAVLCFGRLRSRQFAGVIFMCVTIAAGLVLGKTYSGILANTSAFVTFEVVQAGIVVLWLSAWRRDLEISPDTTRLVRESAKLDPVEEKQMADEGLDHDLKTWPAY